MQTWGANYFIQRVENGEYGRLDIFQGHIDDHKGHHPFLTLREENAERMRTRVRQFIEDSQGYYTVYLRPYHNAPWNSAEKLFIDVQKQLAPVNGQPRQLDIENLVNQRIGERMAEIERARVLDELKAENERLKNPVERLAVLVEMVVSKYVAPAAAPGTPPINGTPGEVDAAEFQKAVNGLVQKFTAAGVIKLNKQLDEQPQMIKLVKDYVRL